MDFLEIAGQKVEKEQLRNIIKEYLIDYINEGIDVDMEQLAVSYNPSHEENVETSEATNPTILNGKYYPNVNVWSIFKRKFGCRNDGNPLVYALKGENGWHFATEQDKTAIYRQIELIAKKFFSMYQYPVTIMLPTQGPLNTYMVELAKKYCKGIVVIDNLMVKLEVSEVREMILLPNSLFRKKFSTRDSFLKALDIFDENTDKMADGIYRSHLMKNQAIRSVIDQTFKIEERHAAKYIEAINGKDVLLLDDNVGHGSTIKTACKEMLSYYKPKSITVLTLFSEKYDAKGKEINNKPKYRI